MKDTNNQKKGLTPKGEYSAKYFCSKCNRAHIKTSNLGRRHKMFATMAFN